MIRKIALALCLLSAATLSAQSQDPLSTTVLRVSRVVLYKTGIGFFEHLGSVNGNQSLAVQFTGDQLDDVLKSLTAVDLGEGRVTGINYDSPTPAERRLQALRVPLAQNASSLQLLGALRGSRVEVRPAGGSAIVGRLLQVERRARQANDRAAERDEITVVSDAGDIVTVALDGETRVRISDADLRQDVGRYLDVAASNGDRSPRRVVLSTSGTGTRSILVSYVAEAAVWKTTYRLVFPSTGDRRPLLQGWAIVDNVSAADWENVELSLVAGAPQTFKQPLSTPLFTTRPSIPLLAGANLMPQIHGAALVSGSAASGVVRDPVPTLQETVTMGSMAVARPRASGPGGAAPFASSVSRDAVEQRVLNQEIAATGATIGDLFEYRLSDPVTIRRNQSALVPILQTAVTAERISLWNDALGARPRRAVWLTNSSNLTLDAGSVAIVDAGAFAGEGLVDSIKPGERRLVSFASDLGVQVSARAGGAPRRTTRIRVAKGIVTHDIEERQRRTYLVRNDDTDTRAVIIEHPARPEWKLAPGTVTVESTSAVHRFRVSVAPGQTTTLDVDELKPGTTTISVNELHRDRLLLIVEQASGRAALEGAMVPIYAKSAELDEIEGEVVNRKQEVQAISSDQQRVRENMAVLKGTATERRLLERYTRQLEAQESRLETLKREVADFAARQARAERELADLIMALSLDLVF